MSFSDFNSTPNPDVFNGNLVYGGAGASVAALGGRLYSAISYSGAFLGQAYSLPGLRTFFGFDFSASFVSGSSAVTESRAQAMQSVPVMGSGALWLRRVFACFVLGGVTWGVVAVLASFSIESELCDYWLPRTIYWLIPLLGALCFQLFAGS